MGRSILDFESASKYAEAEAARIRAANHSHYLAGCGQCGCEESVVREFCPCFSILSYYAQEKTNAFAMGKAHPIADVYCNAPVAVEATVVLKR